ncbi:PREDICTED: chymotrypsin-like elastase family member 2A [Condylura cristata]|uniref:chymotrypsin-like elastase family member 2A n=1 Tax=Condylura cristata TaxID=143302 RepID=UPI000642CDDA|nr:PREDICTED: chymotrypsin-like elastase family member 2A [Condylura cristata]
MALTRRPPGTALGPLLLSVLLSGPGEAPWGGWQRGGVGPGDGLSRPPASLSQLDRPANLNAQVAVAPLPQQGQLLPHGTQCLAMGWGRLGTSAPIPRVLQELNVTVVTFLCRPENVCTFVSRRRAGICFVRTAGPGTPTPVDGRKGSPEDPGQHESRGGPRGRLGEEGDFMRSDHNPEFPRSPGAPSPHPLPQAITQELRGLVNG